MYHMFSKGFTIPVSVVNFNGIIAVKIKKVWIKSQRKKCRNNFKKDGTYGIMYNTMEKV